MGTYTMNYNLFMPSIGEQGWGELVNGNFSTIDTAMKGLDTRVGTLETEMDAVEERVSVLETGEFETINVAGTITADTVIGNLDGKILVKSVSTTGSYKCCEVTPTEISFGSYDINNTVRTNILPATYSSENISSIFTMSADTQIPDNVSVSCTIKISMGTPPSTSNKTHFKVTDNNTGSIVLNTTKTDQSFSRQASFTRIIGHEYTIETWYDTTGYYGYGGSTTSESAILYTD